MRKNRILFQRGRISIDGSKIKRLDSNSNPSRIQEPVVKLKVAVNSTENLNTYSSTTTSTISPTPTVSGFNLESTSLSINLVNMISIISIMI